MPNDGAAMSWDLSRICAGVADALGAHAAALDVEQSPFGLDALDELTLHPLLHAGLRGVGFGVHPEQRYPGHRARARRSEGDRCDIVLTFDPHEHLIDVLASGTLFGHRGVQPREAIWIEVKVVHQFGLIDGVAGPDAKYSSQLLTAASGDVRRLAADDAIRHGAVMLVMFTRDATVADHDLAAWMERALDRGLLVGSPVTERFSITDRIGNGDCAVSLIPVRKGIGAN